jgi:predicted nucleotidyltransferase
MSIAVGMVPPRYRGARSARSPAEHTAHRTAGKAGAIGSQYHGGNERQAVWNQTPVPMMEYVAMPVAPLLQRRRADILRIAATHGARDVRVFGSWARGDMRTDSDIDLLIRLEPGRTLLDLVAIKQDIEDLLNRPVDVVTEAGISPYIRERVLREAVGL